MNDDYLKSFKPVEVEVRNNNVSKAYQILEKKLERAGIMERYIRLLSYEKPSDRRRRKKREMIYNANKKK